MVTPTRLPFVLACAVLWLCLVTSHTSFGGCVVMPMHERLFVQWLPVANAIRYDVEFRPMGQTTWQPAAPSSTTACGAYVQGLTNGLAYEVRATAILGDGSSTTDTGSGTPGAPDPSLRLNQVLQNGQSLCVGTKGFNALTTTQPDGNLMLNAAQSALVPLVEPHTRALTGVEETNASAMANRLSSLAPGFTSVVSIHGWPYSSYGELKKGTPPYSLGMSQMQSTHALALASQRVNRVAAVTIIHGESDDAAGVPASTYASALVEWQHDYETDARAFTGQEEAVPLFTTQMSSWTGSNRTTPTVAIGQLSAARTSSKIHLVMPAYVLEFVDQWHLKAWSYRRMGEYFGKAMKQVLVDGQSFKPLMPLRIARIGNVIEAQFHVPVPPLEFDTSAVVAKAAYGFEYSDASSSATIASVSLTASDTARITLDQMPSATNQRLRYAFTGVPLAVGPRTSDAPNGNLRDSDATPALYHDANVPSWAGSDLRNWCVTFDDSVMPASALMQWRYQHFNLMMSTGDAHDQADPDHDGLQNLAEFALGSDPLTASVWDTRASTGETSPALEYTQPSGGLGTIGVNYAASGVIIAVEASANGRDWLSGETQVEWTRFKQTAGVGRERVRVRAIAPELIASTKVFFRLRMESVE